MKSPNSIIKFETQSHGGFKTQRRKGAKAQRYFFNIFFAAWRLCAFALILVFPLFAQKISIIVPEKSAQSESLAENLSQALSGGFKVLDGDLSETAFRSSVFENPFNLSLEEAKNIGAAIGCDYFLLVKTETLRRSSFKKNEYYESYAVVFAVSSRTGRLVFWTLKSFEAEKGADSQKNLIDSILKLAGEISENLKKTDEKESNESPLPVFEELPAENSPEAVNFRPPLPYKRIKPDYTEIAGLYAVEATVDITVDFDADGKILRTRIERWAGFGLDESVAETVRQMQWRPAERRKKTLPIRVLLRYNFKKIEKDEK